MDNILKIIKKVNSIMSNDGYSKDYREISIILLKDANLLEYLQTNNISDIQINNAACRIVHEILTLRKNSTGLQSDNNSYEQPMISQNINATSLLDIRGNTGLTTTLNNLYTQYQREAYLILDTKNISYYNLDRTVATWNINYGEYTRSSSGAYFSGEVEDLRNITEMRMYKYNIPGLINPSLKRVSVFIHEFSSSSFINNVNNYNFNSIVNPDHSSSIHNSEIPNDSIIQNRWHFQSIPYNFYGWNYTLTPSLNTLSDQTNTNVIAVGTNTNIDENANFGVFKFETPVTLIDTISISLGNPIKRLKFHQDRFIITPIAFTINLTNIYFRVICDSPHNITIPSGLNTNKVSQPLITFSNFTTDDPTSADDQILATFMNLSYAHYTTIAVVNQVTLDLNITDLTNGGLVVLPTQYPSGTIQPFSMYLDDFRYIFSLKFSYN